MKWYFGINERGSSGATGLHAQVAVLTAAKIGDLEPHLLYAGERNAFTRWMEAHDVRIIDVHLHFLAQLKLAAEESRHSLDFLGHWLRSNIPIIESTDQFVLYTDCDVAFLQPSDLDMIGPKFLACAPEFKIDNWNYFNSGVMVMNVDSLRQEYYEFESFIVQQLNSPRSKEFLDQIAYNEFYRRRWERLPPIMNWKPYWGVNEDAEILHFHGPKFDSMRAIVDGAWSWNNPHGRQIGSLFIGNLQSYVLYLGQILDDIGDEELNGKSRIQETLEKMKRYDDAGHSHEIDLEFMNFHLFGEE